jgi:hypothetical protein
MTASHLPGEAVTSLQCLLMISSAGGSGRGGGNHHHSLARTDEKAASALSLDLAGKIVTVLDCGIEDLLEVAED